MKAAFILYDGFSALDFAALYEPLAQQGWDWDACALATDIYDAQGLHFTPTNLKPDLGSYDLIVVPGGPGAQKLVANPAALEWLARAGTNERPEGAARLVGVREGVLLLAAAGLARGRQCAANPSDYDGLTRYGAQPVMQPLVQDGPLLTACGSTAGFELANLLGNAKINSPFVTAIPVTGEQSQTPLRQAVIDRKTGETQVQVRLDIDGSGRHQIATGLPFLDHMLVQVAVHGLFDLSIQAAGDVQIDPHHTLEDVALTLGSAFQQALGDRSGIVRMASADCPMDESLAWVAVDFSGRPYTVFQAEWHGPTVGGLPVSLFEHFFESFAVNARCNLHAAVRYGRDDHHQAEALFKALARALCAATRLDPRRSGQVPSSKGILF